jgi:polar amino acid transport system ATP-binding protein
VLEWLASSGMTMVLVTHEMGFARRTADTLVFMHQGRVWEKGPPRELFRSPRTPELAGFIQAVIEPND